MKCFRDLLHARVRWSSYRRRFLPHLEGYRFMGKDNGNQQLPVPKISSLFVRFPVLRQKDWKRDDRGEDEVDTLFSLLNQLYVRTG